jgi:hypothetical protein
LGRSWRGRGFVVLALAFAALLAAELVMHAIPNYATP